MPQSELLRLEHVVVDGLFDIYDHNIHLNLEDRVTLLHGPNGVGKTVVLKMIDAVLRENFYYFVDIPFERFVLTFNDGTVISLTAPDVHSGSTGRYSLTLTHQGVTRSADINFHLYKAASLAAQIDYLRPHDFLSHTWIDIRDGEELSASEVVGRFSGSTSPHDYREEEEISWFSSFLYNAKTHLIEAQRLVQINSETRPRYQYPPFPSVPSMVSTVVENSKDFQKRLGDTMAHYGRQSQTLDQSFPQRLISASDELSVAALQEQMSNLDAKTAGLKAVGILDETPMHPFPVASLEQIDPSNVRVMTLYVRDTARKLQALDDLATRTRLLLDNVNKKYRNKKIRLDRDEGFVVESDKGKLLKLECLSSGEQHELVLHYDLLFRVRSNTIVLIDEPELSLHVAWQKQFLTDLLEIVQISDFDALVATHSPFVIGERKDLMVGLGGTA